MSEKDDENHDVPADDETPIIEEGAETLEVGEIEPIDPLEEALKRAETAEKEIDATLNKQFKVKKGESLLDSTF